MRLPEKIMAMEPVGRAVQAGEAGEALLRQEAARREARTLVAEADGQGLSCWEADYGLPDWTGAEPQRRRARIRAAMAGGRTLTPLRLRQLAISVGGADEGLVREDFPAYAAEVVALSEGRLPEQVGLEALRQAVERQKPAHLKLEALAGAALGAEQAGALHGGILRVMTGACPVV